MSSDCLIVDASVRTMKTRLASPTIHPEPSSRSLPWASARQLLGDRRQAGNESSRRFKPLSGKGDQGAGPVWRYRDANNDYVTRCNALEDNCTIYRVVNADSVIAFDEVSMVGR